MADEAADPKDIKALSRRQALARLGAGAAYVAPLIVGLNEAAAGNGNGNGNGNGGGNGQCPPGYRRHMGTCI